MQSLHLFDYRKTLWCRVPLWFDERILDSTVVCIKLFLKIFWEDVESCISERGIFGEEIISIVCCTVRYDQTLKVIGGHAISEIGLFIIVMYLKC